MADRLYAAIFGVIYLVLGVLGFVPRLVRVPPPRPQFEHLAVSGGYGFLLSIFPVNIVSDVFYILVGIIGIMAATSVYRARAYGKAMFWMMCGLTFLGMLPSGADRLWGIMPLFYFNTGLFLITALASGYFGYFSEVEPALADEQQRHSMP